MTSHIFLKRIYEPFDPGDGYRILVDRLWPRGVSKEKAKLDEWAKDLAPSSELRKWFGHKPERFAEFRECYLEELRVESTKEMKLAELATLALSQEVTLLYGAKDPIHNHAHVLREELISFQRKVRSE